MTINDFYMCHKFIKENWGMFYNRFTKLQDYAVLKILQFNYY